MKTNLNNSLRWLAMWLVMGAFVFLVSACGSNNASAKPAPKPKFPNALRVTVEGSGRTLVLVYPYARHYQIGDTVALLDGSLARVRGHVSLNQN